MAEAASDKNKLGLWTSTALVIGNMIGSGVFFIPAAMASFGSIGLLGWVFAGIGTFFLARVFSELSKLLPNITGGPYAYTRSGFGDFAGFLIAWGYYISNACGNAAILIGILGALSVFLPVLAHNPILSVFMGLSIVWLLSYINTLGIVVGGKVQLITTILKLTPLFLVAVGGLFFMKAANFLPFNPTGGSVAAIITATAAMTMFSYIGIESATIPAGDVINPAKTIPRATMLGLLITSGVYVLGSVSVMGIIPAKTLEHSLAPYADAAVIIYGSAARYWVSAGVAISTLGCLNGWILIQGQTPYAVARDKMFPGVFALKNKKGVPYVGILVNALIISVLLSMNYTSGLVSQYRALLLVSVLTTLIPYLFSMAAYPIIRARKKIKTGWVAAIILTMLAFFYALLMIIGSGEKSVYYGFLLLMTGLPFYIWLAYKKEKDLKIN